MGDTNVKKQPVVGISGVDCNSKSVTAMVAQIRQAAGIPIVLANHANRDAAADIEKIDQLVVMGNNFDVDPTRYVHLYPENDPRHAIHPLTKSTQSDPVAKARATYEEAMLTLAMKKNLPTLAVCGGMQMINVILGGGMLQHIPDQIGDNHHDQSTANISPFSPVISVKIKADSALAAMVGGGKSFYSTLYTASIPPTHTIGVTENSFHHQAVDPDKLGNGLIISAFSDEYRNALGARRNLVEAIEPDPNGALKDWPMVATQWHPEFGTSNISAKIIQASVERGAEYANISSRDRGNDEVHAEFTGVIAIERGSAFVSSLNAS